MKYLSVLLAAAGCLATVASSPVRVEAEVLPAYEPFAPRSGRQLTIPAFNIDLNPLLEPFRDILRPVEGDDFGLATRMAAASPVGPDCDVGKFQMSDEDYVVVEKCQDGSDNERLRFCIVGGLSPAAADPREFLDREDFSLDGIRSSSSVSLVNGAFSRKRTVSFRMCPRDEINAIESLDGGAEQAVVDRGSFASSGPVPVQPVAPVRSEVQFPIIEVPEIRLPDLSDLFTSIFTTDSQQSAIFPTTVGAQSGGAVFPGFPSFPSFPTTQGFPSVQGMFPSVASSDNCVSERFNLSAQAFDDVRNCRLQPDFIECVKTKLESATDADQLKAFISKPEHEVVGSSFYTTISAVNGLVSRKQVVRLTRCKSAASPDDTDSVPATPEVQQQQDLTPEVQQQQQEQTPETVPEVVQQETLAGRPEKLQDNQAQAFDP